MEEFIYSARAQIRGKLRVDSLKTEMRVGEAPSSPCAPPECFLCSLRSQHSELAHRELDVLSNFLQRTPK